MPHKIFYGLKSKRWNWADGENSTQSHKNTNMKRNGTETAAATVRAPTVAKV